VEICAARDGRPPVDDETEGHKTGSVSTPRLVPELDVSNVPSSLRFYEGVLGFSVAYSRPEEGFVYLEREGTHLMIEQAEGPGRRFCTSPLVRPYGRGVNFQLAVSDAASVRDRAASLGYELVVDLEDRWYRTGQLASGQRQIVVSDPDGYLWRPFQPLGERPAEARLGP
jgi:catechol 2,3-dioxygenase-like lactoylglutathione lyase family enzyme